MNGTPDQRIKVAYWNANGISNIDKKTTIIEGLEETNLDILYISETHLRAGNQEDLSMFKDFNVFSLEREYGAKGGGGMMAIINPRLNHMIWESNDDRFPEVSKEKLWILIHEGKSKVAIGAVYMAAQVTDNMAFKEWNLKLYSMLEHDIRTLSLKGYKCLILGDFNGHIGNKEYGIPGNKDHVNSNGVLLQQFIRSNNLILLNADSNITTGMYTRSAGGIPTILDYGLATKDSIDLVRRMIIDEPGVVMAGSDHVALILDLEINKCQTVAPSNYETINIPLNPDYKVFQQNLDNILQTRPTTLDSLDTQCKWLQNALITAGKKTFGVRVNKSKPKQHNNVPKTIRKLRQQRKELSGLVKRKSIWRAKYSWWTDRDQKSLEINLEKLRKLNEKLSTHTTNHKLNTRKTIRNKTKFGSKEFWKLANKVMRKASEIHAIENENGELITDRVQLQACVLEELSKIFMGQTSKIFTYKGQQLIKAAKVKHQENHDKWVPDDKQPDLHEAEVCRPATLSEIRQIVTRNKDSRASGVDELPTRLFKNASTMFYEQLTDMVNECLLQGETPECLNTGKMTLIDKKEASLKVSKKRPLTVSSQIQSVITKLLAQRMDKICEKENYYGSTQFGFRSGKSTTDCIFLLLAALRKARKKKYQISIAFCDLQKAYDSVDREILYKKLSSIGFGGNVLSLVQSMYYNDNVQVRLGDGLSAPLWFTRGVKQGCCLSPLLFALYVSGLGIKLQESRLGIKLGSEILTGIFFADDLVLISKTSYRGITKLLNMVDCFCRDMRMVLAVSKTYLLTNGPRNRSWKVGDSGETLQETMVAKYLGINIQVRGRHILKREKDIVATAKRYAFSILGLTRAGLDRSRLARILWETCAIPAILYGTEAMTIGTGTENELEKIQGMIGKFILQVPGSTARAVSWLDAGLMPIRYRIKKRKAGYLWRQINKTRDPLMLECIKELFTCRDDPWAEDILNLENEIGISIANSTLKEVHKQITHAAALFVLDNKRECSSLNLMPQPQAWFTLPGHVNDSWQSKAMSVTRAGNAKLGNRMQNIHGKQWKDCPWCMRNGCKMRLSETHVLLSCKASWRVRKQQGVSNYREEKFRAGILDQHKILRNYLGDDGATSSELLSRGASLQLILQHWLETTINL